MDLNQHLDAIIDVFKCCIFTWGIFTTMVPAFILAGAIAAFVPADKVLKYLGARANRLVAYTVATFSGFVLSMCSCNIVPLFISIRKRGAGIGPACALLYSGPAINVLTMVFTFQVFRVIGHPPWLAIWRALGVPVLAVLCGVAMALIWGRAEKKQEETAAELQSATSLAGPRYVGLLFPLLLALMVFGGLPIARETRALWMGSIALLVILVAWRGFEREHLWAWARETGLMVKTVIPIFLVAVLAIAAIARYTPALWINHNLSYRSPYAVTYAAVFGSLMYFPLLTEIAFVKGFLVQQMDTGAGLALLLTGPGLSLPGMILIARVMGVARMLTYVVVLTSLAIAAGHLFSYFVGAFMCPCATQLAGQ